jgi:antitoxin HicB
MGKRYIYRIIIEPDDDRFHAEIPALPGCYSWGYTYDEALTNIKEAAELWLETLAEDGEPIPEEDPKVLFSQAGRTLCRVVRMKSCGLQRACELLALQQEHGQQFQLAPQGLWLDRDHLWLCANRIIRGETPSTICALQSEPCRAGGIFRPVLRVLGARLPHTRPPLAA